MSLSKNVEVVCPSCKEKQVYKVWQSVNVTEDALLREDVFNQDIFIFKCDRCKAETIVQYPFIYHDYEKKFFVYFDPSGNFDNIIETEGYKTKTASDYLEFLEKIKILEDGIDEDIITKAKQELFEKFKSNENLKTIDKIYYSGIKNNKIDFYVPAIKGKITF